LGKINAMRRVILLLLACAYLIGCGGKSEKKNAATGNFKDNDFTGPFPYLELRYHVADSTLMNNIAGERPLTVIGKNYFPDSLIQSFFGKGAKPKFYPLGKARNGDKEIYVAMKAVDGEQRAAFLFCYDGQLNYKDGLILCHTDNNPATSSSATIDKSFNIMIHNETRHSSDDIEVKDQSLVYNSEGFFMDVVNNDPEKEQAMENPLDTFPAKRKYSGDYAADANNFVSIRDGKDSGTFMFYYYFEKKEGCSNKIKDIATFNSKNTALFRKDGDPCVFSFTFNGNQLSIKEDHGCGNYRDMDCTLNGVFSLRKKGSLVADTAKRTTKPVVAKPVDTKSKPAPKAKPEPPKKPLVKKAPVVHEEVQ
jgi:hypothetical protein